MYSSNVNRLSSSIYFWTWCVKRKSRKIILNYLFFKHWNWIFRRWEFGFDFVQYSKRSFLRILFKNMYHFRVLTKKKQQLCINIYTKRFSLLDVEKRSKLFYQKLLSPFCLNKHLQIDIILWTPQTFIFTLPTCF